MSDSLLMLSRSEVSGLLSAADCIAVVESAFRAQARGEIPEPGALGFPALEGGFHVKAAATGQYFVAKINANFPANPARRSLPTIQGVIALFDGERGTPLAIMDSIEITAQRTAAATAVAVKYLARSDAGIAAIIGCGTQARYQLEAVNLARPLREALAVDSDGQRAEKFAAVMTAQMGITVTPAGLSPALGRADIIVTCTPSRRAFVSRDVVSDGVFIAAVGADHPEKQEIDPGLMAAGMVVVDHLNQCMEFGDLHHAVALGLMGPGDVRGTLGEVLEGVRPGRESERDIIIFDSTGTAVQDVAAAILVYERAVAAGAGTSVSVAD